MKTVDERFNLRRKVAIMIGGAGHLGSTLARGMIDSGMRVVILDPIRRKDQPQHDTPHALAVYRCDVTSKQSLLNCRKKILKDFKRVDVLLNAAGINAPTPFLKITQEECQRILGVHLMGTLFSCQVFGETMVSQRSGSIINFASASSGPPLSKAFVYSAAKAAVVNLTQNLAREWAPFHVRVNALRPGFFPTEWSMRHFIEK